ncbi:MAG: YggS family pyridoxal phosphate-dependent enzyme [Ignavibacteria bacterium]|jgi:pyridoxal phosphate enzyme (YggS family)
MIADNLTRLQDRISNKCIHSGWNPEEIKLVAVSKYFGIKNIREAKGCGLTDFGENKAQELRDKFEIMGHEVTWHFIGSLQKNKVKYVVKAASLIHSVDSISLADEINKQAEKHDKNQEILLEIKTSYEDTKAGLIEDEEIFRLAEHCKSCSNLNLTGLMTMAPYTDDDKIIRKSFSDLRKLKDKFNNQGYDFRVLSMGMTGDFEIAIEEGATMLRIGSAIFGARDYSKDWRQI